MRRHRLAWIAAATAITVAPFTPVAGDAAASSPVGAVAPTDAATPTVVKHVDTDVDGDGARDSVDLTSLGAGRFTLSATTTTGKRSSVSFTSHLDPTSRPAKDAWYGADALDGRQGSELIVATKRGRSGNVSLAVYTWRSGKLVAEKAPASPWGRVWTVNYLEPQGRGYRFFTGHGRRYVDATRLTANRHWTAWSGTITRSVWRSGKWVKVSTRKAKRVTGWDAITWGEVAIAGPKLLLDQLDVDVSGDGVADRILIYRTGRENFQVTVSANGQVASRAVRYTSDPFIGAARVEDRAGYELLFTVWTPSDDPEWQVLTWRDGGLADVPGPIDNRWYGASGDDDQTNFVLSADSGSAYVQVARTEWGHYAGNPVHFVRSVWTVDHWAPQAEWDSVLTAEQAAAFRPGFTAPDLIAP